MAAACVPTPGALQADAGGFCDNRNSKREAAFRHNRFAFHGGLAAAG
jgi:hypothetical protein